MLHKANADITELPIKFLDRQKGYSKLPKYNAIVSLTLVIWLRLLEMRYYLKMITVGSVGALIQFTLFNILRLSIDPSYAIAISAECSDYK